MSLREQATFPLKGHIRVYEQDHPENVIFDASNVIVDTVRSLFARLMVQSVANPEPLYGVWGLAIGAGDPSWSQTTQPVETPGIFMMNTPILRKPLQSAQFQVGSGTLADPFVPAGPLVYTDVVSFQTVLNASLDNITVPIREMGLIGGGTVAKTIPGVGAQLKTDPLTANMWVPGTNNVLSPNPASLLYDPANSMTLINYKTTTPLVLPNGVNFVVAWNLQF